MGQSMSQAPVLLFPSPKEAVVFARLVPTLHTQFEKDARTASSHAQLEKLTLHVIRSTVHVRFERGLDPQWPICF